MASALSNSLSSLYALVAIMSLLSVCSCLNLKQFNASNELTTAATWYGAPDGPGSDDNNCGYKGTVGTPPLNKYVTAVAAPFYKKGEGCGQCYQVKCNKHPACSGNPITVTVTDSSLIKIGAGYEHLFDFGGFSFGAMAAPGKADALRAAGKIQISYKRVPCNYPGVKITFKIEVGSNPYFLATNIEYLNGDGDLGKVELQDGSGPFRTMVRSFGATWRLKSQERKLIGPFTLKLTTVSGKSITAQNVIPVGWKAGETYRSTVNF